MMFELVIRYESNSNTESLYTGTLDECHMFANGYTTAVLEHTSYRILKDESDSPIFRSPLVSLSNFQLHIHEIPNT